MSPTASVSLKAKFHSHAPGNIRVGDHTLVSFDVVMSDRSSDGTVQPIRIGANCFVGGGSMILPGVTVGDNSVVGAGAVVFDDVPPRSMVIGNPARIVQEGIDTGPYGQLPEAYANVEKRQPGGTGTA